MIEVEVIKTVKVNGYEVDILKERKLTDHPADWYLTVVLAYIHKKDEYVTWIRNATLGDGKSGYVEGHYFMKAFNENAQDDALKDFNTRR